MTPNAMTDGAPDFVLLAAREDGVIESAAATLREFGAAPQPHELGLRLNCRGEQWRAALAHLSHKLHGPAQVSLRAALIPLAADRAALQKALINAQPIDAFVRAQCAPGAATGYERLCDVFKGESLE
jgi:hypothetical protein